MTWLIPHQPDQTGERKQYGEDFLRNRRALFLAFAVDPVVNVVSRTAAVTARRADPAVCKLG